MCESRGESSAWRGETGEWEVSLDLKSSILTPVTEQRRFCMRDAAGGEQIQTHVLMVSS